MTIVFKTRETKKKKKGNSEPEKVPMYVDFRDGRSFHEYLKTDLKLDPAMWDEGKQMVKARYVCDEKEKSDVQNEVNSMRAYLQDSYNRDKARGKIVKGWLEKALEEYRGTTGSATSTRSTRSTKRYIPFEEYFDDFLRSRNLSDTRTRQYEVVKRTVLRYETFRQSVSGDKQYRFDVLKVDKKTIEDLYSFMVKESEYYELYPDIYAKIPVKKTPPKPRSKNTMRDLMKKITAFFNWCKETNLIKETPMKGFKIDSELYGTPVYMTKEELEKVIETDLSQWPDYAVQRDVFVFQCCVGCRVSDMMRLTKEDVVNGAIEYVPRKTRAENPRTVVVPLNKTALTIVDRYKDRPGDRLLPFILPQDYNEAIRYVLRLCGIKRMVTVIDPQTRTEVKKPLCEVASSHLARRTFTAILYKNVKDQNLVASLTGHAEGSRAFARYRDIDREMKNDLVRLLD
jgi:site-specific recombinase XerD